MTLQQLFDSYGDSWATEAQRTAVSNYEKKYGLKDGAKVTSGAHLTARKTKPETKATRIAGQSRRWTEQTEKHPITGRFRA